MSEIVDLYALLPTRATDGFLSMKEFQRAVNVEMQAIKLMRPID
jgi:hypothetical protein